MKPLQALAVIIVSVALILAGVEIMRPDPAPAPAPDTVYVGVTAKSDTVIRTTLKTVFDVRTVVDTLPGDTIYVPRAVIETLLVRCDECAAQLARHKQVCDSAQRAKDDSIAKLTRRIAQLERQRPWYALSGAVVGALACGR